VRLAGGLGVLVVLVWRVGPGPFVDGLASVDARTLLLGLLLGVPTTLCCAWRWTLVAGAWGVRLPLRRAVPAYYRSQLVNTALPGGVLGDVHRGVTQGRETGDTGRGLRAVAGERLAGQLVLVAVTSVVLVLAPSTTGTWVPLVGGTTVAAATLVAVRARVLPAGAWAAVLLASLGALLGPLATFVVAARTAGVTTPLTGLVPLALLVLLAMAVPLSVAGWGPREGVAAWAFAAAGLGAGAGVATTVVYGVMSLVAVLPGAVALVLVRREAARG
jgi:uncharacterized membrane protein YbhN (UPF0104 family)